MKGKVLSIFLIITLLILPMTATASNPTIATKTTSKILINGVATSFDAYTIGGNNYIKLRDIAYALSGTEKQFEVTWDSNKKAIKLLPGKKYTAIGGEMNISKGTKKKNAVHNNSKVYLDNKEINIKSYTIDNNNYFKIRDLGMAIGFIVQWDEKTSTISIRTDISYKDTWVGRYDEYYAYDDFPYDKRNKKVFSSKQLKKEYIPYILLHKNGTYDFNLNLFTGMGTISGKWEIDSNNKNIVYLSKPTNTNVGVDYDKLILEKVSDSEIVLRGVKAVKLGGDLTTSSYGNVYVKQGASKGTQKAVQYYLYDWARLYIDFIYTARTEHSPYGDFFVVDIFEGISGFMLYDIDSDGIPELFLEDKYEEFYYIYTIKGSKVIYIGSIYNGEATVRENLKTGKRKIFISNLVEGEGGLYSLSSIEYSGGHIVLNAKIFSKYYDPISATESLVFYYIGEKEVSESDYEKEVKKFESSHKIIGEIPYYEVEINDWNDLNNKIDKFIKVFDNYIVNKL